MALEFPIIYLLSTRLTDDELHSWEEKLPTLTYDAREADVIVGKLGTKERAEMELRRLGLQVDEMIPLAEIVSPRSKKRKREDGSSSPACVIELSSDSEDGIEQGLNSTHTAALGAEKTIKVVKLSWLNDSFAQGKILPLDKYLVFEGIEPVNETSKEENHPLTSINVLKRAREDAVNNPPPKSYSNKSYTSSRHREKQNASQHKRPALLSESTTEHDISEHLPPIPDFLKTTYSCQRSTTIHPPNEGFIDQLKAIREIRKTISDSIGVRAYSSAIATLSAYPYLLQSFAEVDRLPGCGPKIAILFHDFQQTGTTREVQEAGSDPKMDIIRIFYNIWGVGASSALDFYNKGWRDTDDIIDYGWGTLTRSQQIGLKYYDEFLEKIPRSEVEYIANSVLEHANRIHKGFEMTIVGGYRRGKEASGDVDLVLSHRDEAATNGIVQRIVIAMEDAKYITHTLTLSLANSERGQMPVAWKGNDKKAGSGFDTLDKALVVWQDPEFPEEGGDNDGKPKKNPNPHRRLDIIVSPWKTVGCAVLGWTSETTFQRDLRRYCKYERKLKFDSSGIRSRVDGAWVDFEDAGKGPAPDMVTAEKRVFEGLGLVYRAPNERLTG